jgi:hypothetical protein
MIDRLAHRISGYDLPVADLEEVGRQVTVACLITANTITVGASAFYAARHASVPLTIAAAVGVLLGWSVSALQRFLVAQPHIEVIPSRDAGNMHRVAVALQLLLLGFIALVVTQPIAIAAVLFASRRPLDTSLLTQLHAVSPVHPVRVIVTAVAVVLATLPIRYSRRSAVHELRSERMRALVKHSFDAHRAVYAGIFTREHGATVIYHSPYEDPPFNTRLRVDSDAPPRPKGSLRTWLDVRRTVPGALPQMTTSESSVAG